MEGISFKHGRRARTRGYLNTTGVLPARLLSRGGARGEAREITPEFAGKEQKLKAFGNAERSRQAWLSRKKCCQEKGGKRRKREEKGGKQLDTNGKKGVCQVVVYFDSCHKNEGGVLTANLGCVPIL